MSDIEARREARRRKVLANAENRLKKITNVEQRNTKSELDGFRISSSNFEDNSLNHNGSAFLDDNLSQISGIINEESQIDRPNSPIEISTIFRNTRITQNDSTSLCEDTGQPGLPRQFYILVLPIVFSLILVIAELFTVDLQTLHLNKIFIPLIAFEIIDYINGPSLDQSSSFLSSILLVSGRNSLLGTYLRYIPFILNLFHDLFLYFFVFIFSHTLWKMIMECDD